MARGAAAAALLTALVLSAPAGAAAPTLRVAGRTPLVLEGRGFKAGEHVRVSLITGLGPRFQRATVTAAGSFRVAYRVPLAGCGKPFAARARGDYGSTAFVVLGKAARCVPPPPRD